MGQRRLTDWQRRMQRQRTTLCSIGRCGKPVEAAGLCAGHRRLKKLGRTVDVELQPPRGGGAIVSGQVLTPWQLLEKAIDEYWECDVSDEQAYRNAKQRLTYACDRFCESRRRR